MIKNNWGGPWTEKKLETFTKYVQAYLTIMRKFSYWETIYFDGFAGSGERISKKDENTAILQKLNLTDEEQSLYAGAAERVLSLPKNLSFNYYYFIDTNNEALENLEKKLKPKFPHKKMVFRPGDANEQLRQLANALKQKKYAALVLLDPFGMQIKWEAISSLQNTRSDIWILVPTGVIINRLLDRKGNLRFGKKLEEFFGIPTEEIKKHFYTENKVQTLFGEETEIKKITQPIEKIATLYIARLQTIWKHVTNKPLVLYNRNKTPIFHFVFASNNETALKIAQQIIEQKS